MLPTNDDDGWSVQSVESSTTLVSTFSGLTEEKSATAELLGIFQEDVELMSLYRRALKDMSMGPERLQRNVARLLQFFAKDLRREAGENIEKMAALLVWSKAQYVAQWIVEDLHIDPQPRHARAKQRESNKDSGKQGEDLAMLRMFLVRSSAFQLFRARLTKFVMPKDLRQSDIDSAVEDGPINAPLSRSSRFSISIGRILKAVLVAAGCLEPPLQPGCIRLRWRCHCGAPLFGDVQEYQVGGVSKLIEQMERSTGSKVTATSYDKRASKEQYIPGPKTWLQEITGNLSRAFWKDSKRNNVLPRHNDPEITETPASVNIELTPTQDLLLLGCVHKSEDSYSLRQDSIGAIKNDQQLFYFIQEQLSHTRNVRWLPPSLKTVTGIHFTKLHVRLTNIEPRLHNLCCTKGACQCIPPSSNAEYKCNPGGPLEFGPPVLPSTMLHCFKHPEFIPEEEMSIFNQLPKRKCGEIRATGQKAAEGWGLYYEENWSLGLIIVVIVGITIPASLIFGICWTLKKSDIQGAWGVSSYMVTTCALVVALLSLIGRAKSE